MRKFFDNLSLLNAQFFTRIIGGVINNFINNKSNECITEILENGKNSLKATIPMQFLLSYGILPPNFKG